MDNIEKPLFFSHNPPLYGVLTLPRICNGALLCVSGFGEEKKNSYRTIVNLCRDAASASLASLRFDLRATGDSDFPFDELSVELWREDIRNAFVFLAEKSGISNPALLSVRLGALLASSANIQFSKIALIAPVSSGEAYIKEELYRKQLRAAISGTKRESVAAMVEQIEIENSIDLDGIVLTLAFYEGLKSLRWEESPPAFFDIPATIFYVGASPSSMEKEIASLFAQKAQLTNSGMKPFWNRSDFEPSPAFSEHVIRFLGK